MNRHLFSTVAAMGLLAAALPVGAAQAAVVYSEDFNDILGFQGSQIDLSGDPGGNTSDRFSTTDYYHILTNHGWTFGGTTPLYALSGSNGAVELNEPSGVAMTLVGLSTAFTYSLTFTYWGDNRPGEAYTLNVSANGNSVTSIPGIDGTPGSNPLGITVTFSGLTTDPSGNLSLVFSQGNNSEASPIFDDVIIEDNSSGAPGATPLPGALPLLASGMGVFSLMTWRKKRKSA